MTALADSLLHTVLSIYSQAMVGMKVEGRTEFLMPSHTGVIPAQKASVLMVESLRGPSF